MDELRILECVVFFLIISNVTAFGILFGRTDFLISEWKRFFEMWIKKELKERR